MLPKFIMFKQHDFPRWSSVVLDLHIGDFDILKNILMIVKIEICISRTTSGYKITLKLNQLILKNFISDSE